MRSPFLVTSLLLLLAATEAFEYDKLLPKSMRPAEVVGPQPETQRRLEEISLPLLADYFDGTPGFYHSVASGSPQKDRVIIWCVEAALVTAPSDSFLSHVFHRIFSHTVHDCVDVYVFISLRNA